MDHTNKNEQKQVNFTKPIKIKKNNFAKICISMCYYPIFTKYRGFVGAVTETTQEVESKGKLTTKTFNDYIESIDIFNYKEIKDHIDNFSVSIANSLLDEKKDFFANNYREISVITDKYKISVKDTQDLRNRLISYFRVVNSELIEMEKSYKTLENLIAVTHDQTSNARSGLTGGAVGGGLGSILLPGVGTIVGGLAGSWFMNKNREKNIIQKGKNHILSYF